MSDFVEQFSNTDNFQWKSPFKVGELKLTDDQIIELISPTLSTSRLEKIHKVVKNRSHSVVTVMENIHDRGNISAAMRSAESFGYYHFHINEPPDGKFKSANRVTKGADKWMYVKKHDSSVECVKQLQKSGYKVYATDLKAARPIDEIDFTQPTAVLFGSEKDGASKEVVSQCDGNIIIPMHGFTQSFNISVAAALTYQHIYKYRMDKLNRNGDLSDNEQKLLLANYMLKSVQNPEAILKMQIKLSKR